LKLPNTAIQLEKSRLHRVFGILLLAEHTPPQTEQSVLKMPVKNFVSAQIALLAAANNLALVFQFAKQWLSRYWAKSGWCSKLHKSAW